MPKKIQLEGLTFGKLTVIRENGISKNGRIRWDCSCSCGGSITVDGVYLRRGEVKSCGCLQPLVVANRNREGLINLLGKRFGRLVVLERADSERNGDSRWVCKCDCNKIITTVGVRLRNGTTKSCGCLSRELSSDRNSTHKMAGTRTWKIWLGMKARCNNPKVDSYYNYGGRGITYCERWENFENFYADMGTRPYGMTLDRIDFDGNYEPSNCRWATIDQQANNTRRNHFITYNGDRKTLTQWSRKLGMSSSGLIRRINKWGMEEAFTRPKIVQKREKI